MADYAAVAPVPRAGSMSERLDKIKIGAVRIAWFQLSAIGPLLVTMGVDPSAFAATGLLAVPAAFVVTFLVVWLFCQGYLAMSRRVPNSGTFYALIRKAFGRVAGSSAAAVSMLGYSALQAPIYGILGASLASLIADNTHGSMHLAPTWWQCALAAWAVVGVLSLLRIDVNATIVGVLACAELAVIALLCIEGTIHLGLRAIVWSSLNPLRLLDGHSAALFGIAILGFIGFEQAPVYSGEARDPRRSVPLAMTAVLALATLAYVAAPAAMVDHYGASTVTVSQSPQIATMFTALGHGLLVHVARVMFVLALTSAALAYQNIPARYLYNLARDGVAPRALAKVNRFGARWAASLVQSAIGIAAIGAAVFFHWDPVGQFFYVGGVFGGLAILILLAVTSLAVVVEFWPARDATRAIWRRLRASSEESVWVRLIAPGLAAVVLGSMAWACIANFATVTGANPASPVTWVLPTVIAVVALLGALAGLAVKKDSPDEGLSLTLDAITGEA